MKAWKRVQGREKREWINRIEVQFQGSLETLFLFLRVDQRMPRKVQRFRGISELFLIKKEKEKKNYLSIIIERTRSKRYIYSLRDLMSPLLRWWCRSRDCSLSRRWEFLCAIILRISSSNRNTRLFVVNWREKYLCEQLVDRSIAWFLPRPTMRWFSRVDFHCVLDCIIFSEVLWYSCSLPFTCNNLLRPYYKR